MPEPVLVIHGVSNRDRTAFTNQVIALNEKLGSDWELIPVFWGDLGAKTEGIISTIPGIVDEQAVRSVAEQGSGLEISLSLVSAEREPVRSSDAKQNIVVQAGLGRDADSTELVRASLREEELFDAVKEEWSNTSILQAVESEELLIAVGEAIAEGARAHGEHLGDEIDTRFGAEDLKNLYRSLVRTADKAAAAALGEVGGRINANIRAQVVPEAAMFLGDIIVYQRNYPDIHNRLFEALGEAGSNYGTEARPINVIGHSLGGVISFYAAVAKERPLWIKSFVTFGSQAPLFHVIDTRGTVLPPFSPGRPSVLPPTIKSWSNLWEPWDVLAFLASRVFLLANGSAPRDVPVGRLPSAGIWTHSDYWRHPQLVDELRQSLIK